MSRFDQNNLERTSTEWGAQALRENLSDRSGHLIVAGIIGGGLIMSATTPLLGGVFALYCLTKGIQSAFASDKNKNLIIKAGCVAHVLKSSDFRDYRRQVGDAKILEELNHAQSEEMALSADAWDFLDELSPTESQKTLAPKIISPNMASVQFQEINEPLPHVALSNLGHGVKTELIEFKKEIPDLPALLAQSLKLTLIVGVPGSGKGIFVSNALESVKRFHPGTTVFYIDPKNDPKETAYFSGRVDKLFRKDLMTASPQDAAEWITNCLYEYDRFDCGSGRKLLVFDELNLTLKTLKGVKVEKGEQSPLEWLKTKLIGYSSSGDSRGIVLWGISQNAHVSGLGMDGGDRTMFIPIFIVDARNISASEGILKAQMIPSDKRLTSSEIKQLCNKSEIERAIFFGATNQWYPMPRLENYSGFDRDSRQFIPGFSPPPKGEKLVTDLDAIAKLESNFKHENISDSVVDNQPKSGLSPKGELVLSFFENAKNKTAKSTKELKDSNKLRELSDSDLLLALRELVVNQSITFDSEGRYLKLDWQ